MSEAITIPSRAVVLPLPYPLVLHPGLMLSIPQSYSQALSLLKAALQVAGDSTDANAPPSSRSPADRPIVVVCVPTLRTPAHVQPPSPTRTLPSPAVSSSSSRNPSSSSHPDMLQPVRINDLFDWGVAARLLRLTRHPTNQTCTLLVTGIQRVRVDRWLSIKAPLTTSALDKHNSLTVPDVPVPLAAVTPFKDPITGWPPASSDGPASHSQQNGRKERERDAETVRLFREAALGLLDAIAQLNPAVPTGGQNQDKGQPFTNPDAIPPPSPALPILPPALLKRIRAYVKDATRPDHSLFPTSASAAADVLIGTLGGACPWASRVSILSEWDPRQRVRAATALLIEGAQRVKTARELFSSLSAPLNKSAKETLARSQLEALLNQLAALNPNISAKVTTGNTTFSIGSAVDDKDSDKDKGSFGIITIRQPSRGEDDDQNNGNNANKSSIIIRGNLPGFGARSRGSPGNGPFDGGAPGGAQGGPGAGEEEDELAELRRKLDQASLSPEARKVCDRELKRLARIPPQSVERGVLVSYLEVMSELPWERVSSDVPPEKLRIGRDAEDAERARKSVKEGEGLVERARRILDEDHYGLDKIKKRLVEYLAVLELKTMQAEERLAEEDAAAAASAAAAANNDGGNSGPTPASKSPDALQSGDNDDDGFQHLEDVVEEQKEAKALKTREALEADRARKRRKAATVKDKGPILLLVGPPGVGKTSIARSLATALQRPLTRLSLGGVRDEAEIRGHRRTYVGAMAGAIASSLRKVGVSDPVMLLDEIDKLGSGNGLHGDPMAAMLEVLDPEQNHSFTDHYINCPIDLSRVLFIATANSLDTISPPLLDRTEVIYVSGYTIDEKIAIARSYLVPKQIKAQGLKPNDLVLSDEVLSKIVSSYTREAGVRSLEREIGSVARAKAVEYAEARKGVKDEQGKPKVYDPVVTLADVERILGVESYEPEVAEIESRPGIATGLAYQGSGNGGVLFIETAMLPPGSGSVKLTGSLGDVIRESAELAISWIKANSFLLGITSTRESEFPKNDLHVHFPSGAVSKDGPSAGIAITCALVGLFTRTAIDPKLAMTGEITLRGQVTPVGGIKEKVLGAHRAGITKILLPYRNRKDVEADLPAKIKADVEIVYVKTIWNALEAAFGHALFEHVVGHHEGVEEGRKRMTEIVEEHRL
ncbi:hypothetical protein OC835_003148 [Tilletia horrida]|nr:hypothetical protein OC835_003148 [Tilletia horrida]